MKGLTIKASVFAALIATSAFASTAAKADQLVSLETAISMLVSQQSQMVFNEVSDQIAMSIEQELTSFNVDFLFQQDTFDSSVTITDIAQVSINDLPATNGLIEHSPK